MERKLLTLKELCDYLGIGETKARELVRARTVLACRSGTDGMPTKNKLDKWLDKMT